MFNDYISLKKALMPSLKKEKCNSQPETKKCNDLPGKKLCNDRQHAKTPAYCDYALAKDKRVRVKVIGVPTICALKMMETHARLAWGTVL